MPIQSFLFGEGEGEVADPVGVGSVMGGVAASHRLLHKLLCVLHVLGLHCYSPLRSRDLFLRLIAVGDGK